MKSRFLHTSMAGSYWEDCEILCYQNFDASIHGSIVDKLFIRLGMKNVEDFDRHGQAGAVIEYYDIFLEDYDDIWISIDRLDV